MKGVSPLLLGPLEHLAPLSDAQARTLSLVFTASYVGSIYVTNVFARRSVVSSRQSKAAGTPSASKAGRNEGEPGVPPIAATDADGQAPRTGQDAGMGGQRTKRREEDPDAPKPGDRDHPDTIKRRVTGVSIATGLSLGTVWYVVALQGDSSLTAAVSTFHVLR